MWLKVYILVVTQIILLNFASSCKNSDPTVDPKIIIIGAGSAGVSALAKLKENGFEKVTLLEAEGRIGGRINTVLFASNVVDLGAQWVHGQTGNVVYKMVQSSSVLDKTPESYFGGQYISSKGEIKSAYNDLVVIAEDVCYNSDSEVAKFTTPIPIGKFFNEKYKTVLQKAIYKYIDNKTATEFFDFYQKVVNFDDCSDSWFNTSTNSYNEYWDCAGYDLLNWRDKGYKTVFDFIAKKRPNPKNDLKVENNIFLNKEVSKITWDFNNDKPINVSCSDGSSYEADHVIITSSLGVLKNDYATLFSPALPAWKENAIKGIGFGAVGKIVLEFNKPFWPTSWSGFGLVWTAEDNDVLLKSEYAWVRGIAGIWRVSYQPNVLIGFTVGPGSREMETKTNQQLQNGIMFIFDKFLKNKFNYVVPKNILISKWYTNPHFRGGYSSISVKTDALNTSANKLAEPLTDCSQTPRIMFAGEATSDHHFSTVHGAVESGYREADRLNNYYQ